MANRIVTGASIFDFTGDGKKTPPPTWATKIGRAVRRMFRDSDLEPTPDPSRAGLDAVTSIVDNHSNFTSLPNMWRVFTDRKAVILDIDRMDVEDEYVSTALNMIADFAVCYDEDGMAQLDVKSKDAEVQTILTALMDRLDLKLEVWQIIRDMVKYGFAPREALIDRDKMQIVGLKQTITYQIYPKCTEKGDKVPGWMVMTDKDIYNGVGGTELEEWQIIPFSYGSKRGYLSVPILAAARRNWMRLSKIEDGMAVARLTRAYDRLVHRVPVKEGWTKEEIWATLKKYKDAITKRKIQSNEGFVTQNENPIDVQTDFFLPDIGDGRGGVETLTSTNLQLGNLNDVYYSRERLIATLRVPVEYLQMTSSMKTHLKSSNRISEVDVQFGRFIRGIHAHLRRSLQRLFDMELILKGKNPSGAYKIDLPDVTIDDPLEQAKIELTMGQAAAFFVESFGALPPELIASKWLELDDNQQALMDKFLASSGSKILKARLDAMVAPPKIALNPASAGSGGKGTPPSKSTKTTKKQSLTLTTATKKAKKNLLYVGRHGQTKLNNVADKSEDRIRGWLDVDLVEEGRKEAKALGKGLKNKGIDKIYASDLKRAKETADIAGEEMGCDDITYVRWLRPWNLGNFQGKKSASFAAKIKYYLDNPSKKVPGGESYNAFVGRFFKGAKSAMQEIADNDETYFFVTHYRILKMLQAWEAAGCPDDHTVDTETFMNDDADDPGSCLRFVVSDVDDEESTDDQAPDPNDGGLQQRPMLERVAPEDVFEQALEDEEAPESFDETVVPLDQAADLFMTLHEKVNQSLREAGLKVPPLDPNFIDVIKQNLHDIAISESE